MNDHAHVENIIGSARQRLVAQARVSWIEEGDGWFLFATAHASRVIVNGAWITEDIAFDDELQNRIISAFKRLGHDFTVYVPDGFARTEASLVGSRFVKRIGFPTMSLNASSTTHLAQHVEGLSRVKSAEDVAAFTELCAVCFEFSPATAGIVHALIGNWSPAPDQQAWLLRIDGKVVAGSMVIVVDGHAVIDWAATHPDVRRKGYGALVTRAAIDKAFRLGANSTVLHASAAGADLYRSIGFREIGTMSLYSMRRP